MLKLLILYLAAVNLLAFFLYGLDKRKAKKERWRIPERTLLGVAALGGALGAFAGMRVFRHKTRKPAFRFGVPLLLIAWIALLILVWPYIPMPL